MENAVFDKIKLYLTWFTWSSNILQLNMLLPRNSVQCKTDETQSLDCHVYCSIKVEGNFLTYVWRAFQRHVKCWKTMLVNMNLYNYTSLELIIFFHKCEEYICMYYSKRKGHLSTDIGMPKKHISQWVAQCAAESVFVKYSTKILDHRKWDFWGTSLYIKSSFI